ncbi:MAG: hypothetical protein LQ352_001319 [Teloschistes flavicans]|nr:MAG: hypothetical protein LQ352_001319 [Teloschistes flavicans]
MNILTRVARRIRDASEEYIERVEDHEAGRRDKYGRKTRAWYEHEYERQRRIKKREVERKEKEERARRKKGAEGGRGQLVGPPMMTGLNPFVDAAKAPSRHGSGSRGRSRNRRGLSKDGSDTLVEENVGHEAETLRPEGAAAALPMGEESTQPAGSTHGVGPAGAWASRNMSPMPNEGSLLSSRDRLQPQRAEQRAKVKARAQSERDSPAMMKDSEDEEDDSDLEDSDGEDEVAMAAKRAKEPRVGLAEGEASGLRGGHGGDGGVEYSNEDDHEYNEHEDFDDEYTDSDQQSNASQHTNDKKYEWSAGKPQSRQHQPYYRNKAEQEKGEDMKYQAFAEGKFEEILSRTETRLRPRHVRVNDLDEKERMAYQPWGKQPERSWRPYNSFGPKDFTKAHHGETRWPDSRVKEATRPSQESAAKYHPQVRVAFEIYPQRAKPAVASLERDSPPPPTTPADRLYMKTRIPGKQRFVFVDRATGAPAFAIKPKVRIPHVSIPAFGRGIRGRPGGGSGTQMPRWGAANQGRPRPTHSWTPYNGEEEDEKDDDTLSKSESDFEYDPSQRRNRGEPRSKAAAAKPSSDSSETSSNPRSRRKDKSASKAGSKTAKLPPAYDSVVVAPLNHYAVLGLKEDATAEEIKTAGKKMRIKFHPDRLWRDGMTEAEKAKISAKSARIGQATDLLEDPDQKQKYDIEIRAWKRMHGGRLPKEHEY